MMGHIVIFGNRGAETAALIQCLIADNNPAARKLSCAHTRPSKIHFPISLTSFAVNRPVATSWREPA
jgi:hypothetical protein